MGPKSIFFTGLFILIGFIGLCTMFGSWYTIDSGERGVRLRNGAVVGIAEPGLGFKTPWIDSVVHVNVQTISQRWSDVNAYSSDQQPVDMIISVNFHIAPDKVDDMYSRFGTIDSVVKQLLSPHVYQESKVVFGHYTAVKAIQSRDMLNSEIRSALMDAVRDEPMVQIESIQIENIQFSKAYEASIEQRMLAEVEVQKIHQNAEREKVTAEITVIQAKAAADAVRAKAQADADAIVLRGNAEAQSIKARGDALRDNPNLVTMTTVDKWDGRLPQMMVPNAAVPFLNLQHTANVDLNTK